MKRTFATLGVVGLGLVSLTAPAMAAPEKVIVCHSDGSSWTPLEFNINGLSGHDQHPLDIIPPTSKSPGKNWTDAGKLLYVAKCAPLPPGETLPEVDPPVEEPPVEEPPVEDPHGEEPPVEEPPVEEPPAGEPPAGEDPPVSGQVPEVEPPAATPVVEQPAEVPAAGAPPAALPAAGVPAGKAPVAAPAPRGKAQQQAPARAEAAPAATSVGTNQGYNAQTAVGGSDSSPSWLAGLGALAAAGAAVAVRRRTRLFSPAG